jgi:hypothetical protein
MPFVICAIHGGGIAPHGCEHVAKLISARQAPGRTTHVDLDGIFMMGWVCDACLETLNRHGLQAYLARHKGLPDYPPEEEIEPLLDLLDLQPMCSKCFEGLSKTPPG